MDVRFILSLFVSCIITILFFPVYLIYWVVSGGFYRYYDKMVDSDNGE